MKQLKKLFAVLLSLMLLVGLIPMQAFATETASTAEPVEKLGMWTNMDFSILPDNLPSSPYWKGVYLENNLNQAGNKTQFGWQPIGSELAFSKNGTDGINAVGHQLWANGFTNQAQRSVNNFSKQQALVLADFTKQNTVKGIQRKMDVTGATEVTFRSITFGYQTQAAKIKILDSNNRELLDYNMNFNYNVTNRFSWLIPKDLPSQILTLQIIPNYSLAIPSNYIPTYRANGLFYNITVGKEPQLIDALPQDEKVQYFRNGEKKVYNFSVIKKDDPATRDLPVAPGYSDDSGQYAPNTRNLSFVNVAVSPQLTVDAATVSGQNPSTSVFNVNGNKDKLVNNDSVNNGYDVTITHDRSRKLEPYVVDLTGRAVPKATIYPIMAYKLGYSSRTGKHAQNSDPYINKNNNDKPYHIDYVGPAYDTSNPAPLDTSDVTATRGEYTNRIIVVFMNKEQLKQVVQAEKGKNPNQTDYPVAVWNLYQEKLKRAEDIIAETENLKNAIEGTLAPQAEIDELTALLPTILQQYAQVTLKVQNGTWKDSKTSDITIAVKKGKTLKVEDIPTGMIPNANYQATGAWYPELSTTTTIDENTEFTYSFPKIMHNVTFKVVNGTWDDNTTEDKVENVPQGDTPQLPTGMKPNENYEGGTWSPAATTAVTAPQTYTYTFTEKNKFTVTYNISGGTWQNSTTTPIAEEVYQGNTPANIPSGMQPDATHKESGSWNDANIATTPITQNTAYTYTYPEKPSYTVTYKVVNGKWDNNTNADITVQVLEGNAPTSIPTGMTADDGFKGGAWDTDPNTATITQNTTFTYTFTAKPKFNVTFKIVNGNWQEGNNADQTVQVMEGESPTLPTGMTPAEGYEGGSWSPATTSPVTVDTEYTYTFTAKPKFTVTYEIVNGKWQDNSTANKTEEVTKDATPTNVPTGMQANPGYGNGAWNENPATTTITANKTFTYSFTTSTVNQPTVSSQRASNNVVVSPGDFETTKLTVTYEKEDNTKVTVVAIKAEGGNWSLNNAPIEGVSIEPTTGAITITASNLKNGSTVTAKAANTIGTESTNATTTVTNPKTYFTATEVTYNTDAADKETLIKDAVTKATSAPNNITITAKSIIKIDADSTSNAPTTKGTYTATVTVTYSEDGEMYGVQIPVTITVTDPPPTPTHTITYKVVNGTWSDDTTADIVKTVNNGDNNPDVPTGMKASAGFTGGAWSPSDPTGEAPTVDTVYTYTFTAVPAYTVTYNIVGGTFGGTDTTKTEQVLEGSTPTQIPTNMQPNVGFGNGAWNDENIATTPVNGNVTYTYTYVALPPQTYTVTYKVENGQWNDGTTADKTEQVTEGSAPNPPTGMTPNPGFEGGSWSPSISATVNANVTYTYAFTAAVAPPPVGAPFSATPVSYVENNATAENLVLNAIAPTRPGIIVQSKEITKVDGTPSTSVPQAQGTYNVTVKVTYTEGGANEVAEVVVPITVTPSLGEPFAVTPVRYAINASNTATLIKDAIAPTRPTIIVDNLSVTAVNGTPTALLPNAQGNYTVSVAVNYTENGTAKQATVSVPVAVYQEAVPTPTLAPIKAPKTGDNENLAMLFMLLVLSIGTLSTLAFKRKRNR